MSKRSKYVPMKIPKETICKICYKPSVSMKVNRFCMCIASEDDFTYQATREGSRSIVTKVLKQERVPELRALYNCRVGIIQGPKKFKKKDEESMSRKQKNKFYQSWEWKELRFKVLTEYGARCMLCGITSKEAKICVDHIIPVSTNWELRLDQDNLQVLCDECNKGKSNKSTIDFR
jgi:5-methylcytosine-specific restriction endonuclease McrA